MRGITMARHDLPSGGWVELRDGIRLRAKDQRRIVRSVRESQAMDQTMLTAAADGQPVNMSPVAAVEVGFSMTDGLIAALVTDWKLPYDPDPAEDGTPREWVLPSRDPSIVIELDIFDYNALAELVRPTMEAAFPGKPDPTDYDNKQSPTAPASGSGN